MGEGKDERLMFLLDSFLEDKEDCSIHDQVLGAVPMDYVSKDTTFFRFGKMFLEKTRNKEEKM